MQVERDELEARLDPVARRQLERCRGIDDTANHAAAHARKLYAALEEHLVLFGDYDSKAQMLLRDLSSAYHDLGELRERLADSHRLFLTAANSDGLSRREAQRLLDTTGRR